MISTFLLSLSATTFSPLCVRLRALQLLWHLSKQRNLWRQLQPTDLPVRDVTFLLLYCHILDISIPVSMDEFDVQVISMNICYDVKCECCRWSITHHRASIWDLPYHVNRMTLFNDSNMQYRRRKYQLIVNQICAFCLSGVHRATKGTRAALPRVGWTACCLPLVSKLSSTCVVCNNHSLAIQ